MQQRPVDRVTRPKTEPFFSVSEEQITAPDFLSSLEPKRYTLKNGIPVYELQTGVQEIVKVDVIVQAGGWYAKKPLIASFANELLQKGTKEYSSDKMAELLDFYGASIYNATEKDNSVYALFSTTKHIKKTLSLFSGFFTSPAFLPKEFELLKSRRKQHYLVNQERPTYVAATTFNTAIFGAHHPYGYKTEFEDYDTLSLQEVTSFFSQHYTADRIKIVASGRLPVMMQQLLEDCFGGISRGKKQETLVYPSSFPDPLTKQVSVGNGLQTSIRIGNRSISMYHPDYYQFALLVRVLGGYFGSRLMKNIREAKGLTYGIGAILHSFLREGVFGISSQVKSDLAQLAIDEIVKEVKRLQEEPIGAEELSLVKNYTLGQVVRSMDGLYALSDLFCTMNEFGHTRKDMIQQLRVLRDTTPEDLLRVANEHIVIDKLTIVTAG